MRKYIYIYYDNIQKLRVGAFRTTYSNHVGTFELENLLHGSRPFDQKAPTQKHKSIINVGKVYNSTYLVDKRTRTKWKWRKEKGKEN